MISLPYWPPTVAAQYGSVELICVRDGSARSRAVESALLDAVDVVPPVGLRLDLDIMRIVRVALPPHRLHAGFVVALPPHGLVGRGRRALPPHILLARGRCRLPTRCSARRSYRHSRTHAVIERLVLIPQRHAVAARRRAHVERERARRSGSAGGSGRQIEKRVLEQVPALVIGVDVRPIDPGPALRLERLDALELDIEVELQPGDIAIRQVRESRVAEGIVLLEQQHDREIALVAEDAGDVEAGVGRAPQGSRRAIGVKALEVHGPVGLELVDRVHDCGRRRFLDAVLATNGQLHALANSSAQVDRLRLAVLSCGDVLSCQAADRKPFFLFTLTRQRHRVLGAADCDDMPTIPCRRRSLGGQRRVVRVAVRATAIEGDSHPREFRGSIGSKSLD